MNHVIMANHMISLIITSLPWIYIMYIGHLIKFLQLKLKLYLFARSFLKAKTLQKIYVDFFHRLFSMMHKYSYTQLSKRQLKTENPSTPRFVVI
jgi:biopolymer transport protein ExbB/TolQ